MGKNFLLFAALLLGGCASNLEPPQTVGQVNLQRYQGLWYEQARLPMFFQRKCVQSEARYQLQADGSLAVDNRCRTADGEWIEARGQAVPQEPGRTDKLWVRFDNWFSRLFPGLTKGEYWVLYLDADYRSALVGHPSRDYLWLLTRQPQAPAKVRDRLLQTAREQGYDTDELIWRQADATLAGQ
ncbi:MAG TPA: lipocalin family protein [Pseudomonas sp.]|nr:lipocalin family protein [Pseudomonas sp.]